jgi:hypothetical protein
LRNFLRNLFRALLQFIQRHSVGVHHPPHSKWISCALNLQASYASTNDFRQVAEQIEIAGIQYVSAQSILFYGKILAILPLLPDSYVQRQAARILPCWNPSR